MITDMHCHVEFGDSGRNEGHEAPVDEVEEFLAKDGVERAVLLTYSPEEKTFEGYRRLNAKLAEYVKDKPHHGFARIDPKNLSEGEVERLMYEAVELGLSGIKLHPLDNYPIEYLLEQPHAFELAESLQVPVIVHTWFDTGRIEWEGVIRNEPLMVVSELAGRYSVPFIAAHVNVGEDPDFERAMQQDNLYVDVSLQPFSHFRDYVARDPSNPLLNRVFYASDFGVCKMPQFRGQDVITPDKIRTLPVADKLLETNADRFIDDYLVGNP